MSNETIDSKKKSASEAFVNSFGGYPIGYGLGIMYLFGEILKMILILNTKTIQKKFGVPENDWMSKVWGNRHCNDSLRFAL